MYCDEMDDFKGLIYQSSEYTIAVNFGNTS